MMTQTSFIFFVFAFLTLSCTSKSSKITKAASIANIGLTEEKEPSFPRFDSTTKTIHILVALCDNENQGIVPVPAMIGNGQDPRNNLYWGAGFGIKTYFKRSKEWEFIESRKVSSVILERIIFKHKITGHFLVADAYDGRYIKQTTLDLLQSSAGLSKDTVMVNNQAIGIHGNANLVAYIGHDGLMDFELNQQFVNQDSLKRDVIILACFSKHYFNPLLSKANVNPLVWTTGLMAPEAYTIHDALSGYVLGETNEEIRLRAAMAYANYQKCSLRAAKNLLVTKNQK